MIGRIILEKSEYRELTARQMTTDKFNTSERYTDEWREPANFDATSFFYSGLDVLDKYLTPYAMQLK